MSQERIKAPELADGLEWFNVIEPVRIADQRGRVVLLDFWTYSSINCMHTHHDLRHLEDKFGDRLLVISIHSPKFPHERVPANLQKAINRYPVRHPVVNDPSFKTWKQYNIRAWPSLIFIDPDGYIVGLLAGEGRRDQLEKLIEKALRKAAEDMVTPDRPLALERKPEPNNSSLYFPGKILATENSIYISDSGHNRIVVINHHGRINRVFGMNSAGMLDGFTDSAAFNHPNGMVKVKDALYVADTGNHAIRRINLVNGEVETIAGNGKQGRYESMRYNDARTASLNSPWDLAYDKGYLYISMAGQHQIWRLHLSNNVLERFVGTGREDLTDGVASNSALAQPSGLALGGNALFVSDAETSAVRIVRIPDGKINTLVGEGLFEFGDRDGTGKEVRLQYPLDVEFSEADNIVYIADSFNNKIKLLDITTKAVHSLEFDGLYEPSGISLHKNFLWIANTNNHCIGRLDLQSGLYETLELNEPIDF